MNSFPCVHPVTGATVTFYVHVEAAPADAPTAWQYLVSAGPQLDGEFYEARFVPAGEDRLRPDVLDNHGDARYRGQGITEAVFADVAARTGRAVVSSRKDAPDDGREWRSAAADRLWMKLAARGKAAFDPDDGRFIYLSEGSAAPGSEFYVELLDTSNAEKATPVGYVRIVVQRTGAAEKWEARWCTIGSPDADVHRTVEKHSPGTRSDGLPHEFSDRESALVAAETAVVEHFARQGKAGLKVRRLAK